MDSHIRGRVFCCFAQTIRDPTSILPFQQKLSERTAAEKQERKRLADFSSISAQQSAVMRTQGSGFPLVADGCSPRLENHFGQQRRHLRLTPSHARTPYAQNQS